MRRKKIKCVGLTKINTTKKLRLSNERVLSLRRLRELGTQKIKILQFFNISKIIQK